MAVHDERPGAVLAGPEDPASGDDPLRGRRKDAEIVRVTGACDQRCVFCNAREDIGAPSRAELEARITALAAEGLQRLVLSGGEPTLRKDLPDLVRHARAAGIPEVELQTNAIRAGRETGYAAALVAAGVTSAFVALHAHEAELSDALTGAPGTFVHTKAGARALMDAGVPTTLNIVVNRRNYRILPDYVRFVAREVPGFESISFSFVMSGGGAFKNRWVIPRMSEVAPYLRAAYAWCLDHGVPFSNPGCGVPVCFVPGFERVSDEWRQLCGADLQTLAELRNNQREKQKVDACGSCVHDPYCLGLWKGYVEVHGADEVVPVHAVAEDAAAEDAEEGSPAAGAGFTAEALPARTGVVLGDGPLSNDVLRLTLACNERCRFCNVPPEGDPEFHAPTNEEARAFIDHFAARTAGTRQELSFSGGEPLLRADLEDLVAYARERGIERVQLQTNATRMTPDRAVSLRAAGATSAFVAYHSHLDDAQDALTGMKDSGAATRKGIQAALKAGIPVSVNPVLTRLNLASFPDFVDHLAETFGADALEVVCVTLVQPHGRAAKGTDLLPRYSDTLPALTEALRRAAAHGIRTDTHYASLPLCHLLPEQVAASLEYRESAALRARPADAPPLEARMRRVFDGKIQGPPCRRCVLRNHCNGVWRAYVQRHGWGDIVPPRRTLQVWGPIVPADGADVAPSGAAPGGPAAGRALVLRLDQPGLDAAATLAAARREGAEQVTFTGPEPTRDEALPGLVARARDLGYLAIQVVTNARRLGAEGPAAALVRAGLTEALVPLWAADPATHDRLARTRGAFVQTLRGVQRLLAAARAEGGSFRDVTVTLGVPVTRHAVGDLAGVVALASRLGVREVAFLCRADAAAPPEDAIAPALRAAAERAEADAVAVTLHGFPPFGDATLDALREEARAAATPTLVPLAGKASA